MLLVMQMFAVWLSFPDLIINSTLYTICAKTKIVIIDSYLREN